MTTIENDQLRIAIHIKGAELNSIVNKASGIEHLWNADPAIWPKHSPVLFPIVGTLRENEYLYSGQAYTLSRHGFARDMPFQLADCGNTHAAFVLTSNDDTRLRYPFDFRFEVKYEITNATLQTTYTVTNTGAGVSYFSVGGHPAFAVPYEPGTAFEDYYFEFPEPQTADRWPISKEGLIETSPKPLLKGESRINISRELFSSDAIVFKQLLATEIALKSDKSSHGLNFNFSGFPYLGLWATRNGNFVCIEPWCGIADSVDANQRIEEKEGIERLYPGHLFTRSWTLSVF